MLHLHDCTCLNCFDRLRQDHDRAQEQAIALLTEMGGVEKELRAMADLLSRHLSPKPLVSDG
jgi:hypothetical protein